MQKLPIYGLAACLVSTAYSQMIKVSGTVKNAANQPVANAIVELVHAKAKDTTGADGAYSLSATPNAVRRDAAPISGGISLQKGILELATAQAAPIQIEILGVNGNLLDRINMGMASPGTYRLNLADRIRSQNLVLVKATVGRTTKAFPYLPAGFAAASASFSPDFSAQAGASLAKVAAAVDTLQVSASGFAMKRVELASAEATVDVTLEASTDIWGGLKNLPGKSDGCGKATTITNGTKTITSGGKERNYIIDLPANYDPAKPYRLIYVSHGMGGKAQDVVGFLSWFGVKAQTTAANDPAVLIAMNAINGQWGESDHVLFDDVTNFVFKGLCIDTTRVFVTGMSMGGMFSYSLSTDRQKRIRAGVGIAPTNYNIWLPATKLKDPMAWMQTTGNTDNFCPWVNNEAQKRGSKFIALEKAADNGCTIPAEVPFWKSGPHICYDFAGCTVGYPVKACTFQGAHVDRASDPGSNVNWIAAESWKFMTQF
ncbi:MAG: hypothetical protein ABIW76_08440 [Fibrobacteria bacterium]